MDKPWQKKSQAFGNSSHAQKTGHDKSKPQSQLMTSSLFNQLLRSTSAKKFENNSDLERIPSPHQGRPIDSELQESLKYLKGLRKQLKQNISNFMKTTNASLEEVPSTRHELANCLSRSNKETLLFTLTDFTAFYTEEAKKNATSNLLILNQIKKVLTDLENKGAIEFAKENRLKSKSREKPLPQFREEQKKSDQRVTVDKLDKASLLRINQKYTSLVSTQQRFTNEVNNRVDEATSRLFSLEGLLEQVRSSVRYRPLESTPRDCYTCTFHQTESSILAKQLEEKQKNEIQLTTELGFEKKRLEKLQRDLKQANVKLSQAESHHVQGVTSQLESLQEKYKKTKEELKTALSRCAKLEVEVGHEKKELEVKVGYLVEQNLALKMALDEKDGQVLVELPSVTRECKATQTEIIRHKSQGVQAVILEKIEEKGIAQSCSTQFTTPRLSHANIEELIITNKTIEATLRSEIDLLKTQLKLSNQQANSEFRKKEETSLEMSKLQEDNIKLKEQITEFQKETSSLSSSHKSTLRQTDQFLETFKAILSKSGLNSNPSSLGEASTTLLEFTSRFTGLKSDIKALEGTLKEIENVVTKLSSVQEFPLEEVNSKKSIIKNLVNCIHSIALRFEMTAELKVQQAQRELTSKIQKLEDKGLKLILTVSHFQTIVSSRKKEIPRKQQIMSTEHSGLNYLVTIPEEEEPGVIDSQISMSGDVTSLKLFKEKVANLLHLPQDSKHKMSALELLSLLETKISTPNSSTPLRKEENLETLYHLKSLEEENQRLKSTIEKVDSFQKTQDKEELEKFHSEIITLKNQLAQSQKKIAKLSSENKSLKVVSRQKKVTVHNPESHSYLGSNEMSKNMTIDATEESHRDRERISSSQTPHRTQEKMKPKEVLVSLKKSTPQASREQVEALRRVHVQEMVKFKQLKSSLASPSRRLHPQQRSTGRTQQSRKVLPRGQQIQKRARVLRTGAESAATGKQRAHRRKCAAQDLHREHE